MSHVQVYAIKHVIMSVQNHVVLLAGIDAEMHVLLVVETFVQDAN